MQIMALWVLALATLPHGYLIYRDRGMFAPRQPGKYKFFVAAYVLCEFVGQTLLALCFKKIVDSEVHSQQL